MSKNRIFSTFAIIFLIIVGFAVIFVFPACEIRVLVVVFVGVVRFAVIIIFELLVSDRSFFSVQIAFALKRIFYF